jgi:hypothetical protein
MIADFEQELVTRLGTRLSTQMANRLDRADGTSNQSGILIGVKATEPIAKGFGAAFPRVVPGSDSHRRVVRLRCTVGIEFRTENNSQDRTDLLSWFDTVVYALDAPDFQDGSALSGPPDPGFLIERLCLDTSQLTFTIQGEKAEAFGVHLLAEGWFWPAGIPGETGIPVEEVRLRQALLPMHVSPARPQLTAGGPAQNVTIRFEAEGLFQITAAGTGKEDFGSVAVRLLAEDGGSGVGTLSGGTAGEEGVRLLPVTGGGVTVTITPPAEAARETLVVALANGSGGLGVELGRVQITTLEA